ncbi:MAG: aminotransferase class V-fold PLP-dependent enzyme [Chitinophagaceae bacterium]|nr:aminotransferase class V-fold PLP-dependent enzyme [Chitinophagaceae bacterium]
MSAHHLKDLFLLDPSITFLNFGSFGACPKPVFEDYQRWQLELEREPVQFITKTGYRYLQESREALGAYIGCKADDVVFVMNPSYAVNIIAKSLDLKPGDEVLTTNIEYGACDKTWNYYCEKKGARYIRQNISLPLTTEQQFVDDFFKGCTPRTKLIFISHITSATALRLPVDAICAEARKRGIMTFVDGAHAPGQVPLNMTALDADIYTGACHKWMMAPKGCSFLYVKGEHQHLFDPLIISWGFQSPMPSHSLFLDYHQLQGTRDFSAFLTIPKAIEFMQQHQWESVAADCRQLVQTYAPRFCALMNTQALCPIDDQFLVQLFSIPINTTKPEALQQHLFDHYRIEIPVTRQDDRTFIRYSINGFNTAEDLEKLYVAMEEMKGEGWMV